MNNCEYGYEWCNCAIDDDFDDEQPETNEPRARAEFTFSLEDSGTALVFDDSSQFPAIVISKSASPDEIRAKISTRIASMAIVAANDLAEPVQKAAIRTGLTEIVQAHYPYREASGVAQVVDGILAGFDVQPKG